MYFHLTGQLTTGTEAAHNAITWHERVAGTRPTIELFDSTGNNVALSVAVAQSAITVTLGTGASSSPNSTAAQVIAAVQATPAAAALVTCEPTGTSNGTGIVAPIAATPVSDAIRLPRNLHWADEHAWAALEQTTLIVPGPAGVPKTLVLDRPRTTGRPITLVGPAPWSWITRAALLTLTSALDVAGARFLLSTPAGDTYLVAPRRDPNGVCLQVTQRPAVGDKPQVDPTTATLYGIESLTFITV